jgi:hypothetical protein
VANRYFDLIVEQDGELRFAYRTVIFEWRSVTETDPGALFPEGWPVAKRDRADLTYRTLGEVRAEYELKRAQVYGG